MAVIGSADRAGRGTPTRDLGAYLHGEYRAGVPWKTTVRHASATGYELSDRIVSRLEIANALRDLPYRQKRLVELVYEHGLSRQQACHRLGISDRTFDREQAAALRAIVDRVYEWTADGTTGAA